jgi:hypothetical protein
MKHFRRFCFALVLTALVTMPALGGIIHTPGGEGETQCPPATDPGDSHSPGAPDPGDVHTPGAPSPGDIDMPGLTAIMLAIGAI